MTGGVVVVLGPIGRNFAAGMTGGVAYLWDPEGELEPRCGREPVRMAPLDQDDRETVRTLVAAHGALTGSLRAQRLLDDWDDAIVAFRKAVPAGVTVSAAAPSPQAPRARSAVMASFS
jgi:glutamate synthase domain-containing protein 3